MSIVAAARHEGRVVMGCDSLVAADDLSWRSGTKVHRFGSSLLGVVGACRVELRIVHALAKRADGHDITPEHVGEVVRGATTKRELGEIDLLMATTEGLWGFEAGWPSEVHETYWAIGAAQWVALGAMWPTPAREPETRVRAALHACAYHCRGCVGEPFIVETI